MTYFLFVGSISCSGRFPLSSDFPTTLVGGDNVSKRVWTMVKVVVLVVEDEPLIRLNAIQIIEHIGHEAVEAANADEAILVLERRADVRIVFTDINMPGSMDGLKLAQAVRNRWPPIRLIVTSGKVMLNPGDLPLDGRFLAKPYSADQIVSLLSELAA